MTPAEIIYQRRARVLDVARKTGNVAATCRTFGVSRATFYKWRSVAERYGVEALWPMERRAPQMPNATPTWVVNELLTFAAVEPTLVPPVRGSARRSGLRDSRPCRRPLVRHSFGRRSARVARAATISAHTTGLVTEAVSDDEPFGFCHFAARPGDLVALDSFYIGNLKGVGKEYQLTAIDTATRCAYVMIVLGTPTGAVTARFIETVIRRDRATPTTSGGHQSARVLGCCRLSARQLIPLSAARNGACSC